MSDPTFAVPAPVAKPQVQAPPLSYEKPPWSSESIFDYSVEVLKNGASIETIQGPKKEFITIGRLPICDMPMEHPSISRYHAIIQFNTDGEAFLYDMNSAHGTLINKKAAPSRQYVLLKPGDQLRFGESTRICIFESKKPYDPEAELEEKKKEYLRQKLARAKAENEDQTEDQGISWGFGEDAEEDEEPEEEDEEEREERDARIGKALDADLIDIEAEKMASEETKRRREDLEIMFGDDSDEELYDQTARKKKKKEEKADTHDDLIIKQKATEQKIKQLKLKIEERKRVEEEKKNKKGQDEDLETYMMNLYKSSQKEKSVVMLGKELQQLIKDNERLVKLVKLTKPLDF
ncbi:SMAD/FHA domain-containing protein [Backusella circina FSU 941]|nr:SMAD/FHA domain-containing protein [Backusella circina FSU 941]